jgi:6-pyruvoyltetrahydropterin/6-carboxytetrahydropterin synthase
VRVGAGFEAAHALRDYVGGPEPIHGHSWRIEVALETTRLDRYDLSVDFVPTRALVEELAKRLDTRCINDLPPFDRLNPTAENVARWFAGEILASGATKRAACRLVEISVWEGPNNRVTWEPAHPPGGQRNRKG